MARIKLPGGLIFRGEGSSWRSGGYGSGGSGGGGGSTGSRISAPPGLDTGPQFGGGTVSFVGGGITGGSAPGLPGGGSGGGGGGSGGFGGGGFGGGVGSMMPGAVASSYTNPPPGMGSNPNADRYSELLQQLMGQFESSQGGARERAEEQYQKMLAAVNPVRANLDAFAHSQRMMAADTGQQNLADVAKIGEAARTRTNDQAAQQAALARHAMMSRGMSGTTAMAGAQRGIAADTARRMQEIDEQQAMLRTGVRDTTSDRHLSIIGNRASQEMPMAQMYANVHAARQEDTMNPNVLLGLIQQLSAASS